MFKYLERLLVRSEDDWPAVLRNTRKAGQVGWRLEKMLWREGAEPALSDTFFRAVIHALLLFGADTWVLLVPTAQKLEVVHLGFLIHVKKLKGKRLRAVCGGRWRWKKCIR